MAEVSETDSQLSLPRVVTDEALGNLSSLDSHDPAPSNWGLMDAVPAAIRAAFTVWLKGLKRFLRM